MAGITVIELRVGAITLSVVEPLTAPEAAIMVLLPVETDVANPAALIVATVFVAEVQVTELVRFWMLPSLKVPVAVNCCAVPLTIVGSAGVTAIELSFGVTVSLVDPFTDPEVAVIVLFPGATPVTKPLALTVANAVDEEVQVAEFVKFCVLPSLKVPVAVNCCVVPG